MIVNYDGEGSDSRGTPMLIRFRLKALNLDHAIRKSNEVRGALRESLGYSNMGRFEVSTTLAPTPPGTPEEPCIIHRGRVRGPVYLREMNPDSYGSIYWLGSRGGVNPQDIPADRR